MSPGRAQFRRGLTFIELVLALAITAMVAAAIAAMIGAVTSGEMSRRDNRGTIIRVAIVGRSRWRARRSIATESVPLSITAPSQMRTGRPPK